MQRGRLLVVWIGALAAIPAGLGCSDQVRVYPVRGKITFEGKPMVGGGSIAFVPLGMQKGKTGGGEVLSDGTYELMTHRPGDGSMLGEFRVVIHQVVEQEPVKSRDGEKAAKPVAAVPLADRIPAIYSDHQQSPLRATVEAKNPNEINFDLKRNPAPAAEHGGQGDGANGHVAQRSP